MKEKMWAVLLHLSMNMWEDFKLYDGTGYSDVMTLDRNIWNEATKQIADCGLNTVVIDLGNAVKYRSHPEIAVSDAWEVEELKEELKRLRQMGLNPIPKLNFSTGHDAWLKDYSRMVSSPIYYQVCKDLIHEVIEIFDSPTYFHLGMDEERAEEQEYRRYEYICYRKGKLFWNDLKFLLDCVKEKNVTPWIWADHFWYQESEFVKIVPKDVLISPWYYQYFYNPCYIPEDTTSVLARKSFTELEKNGYKQVPTGSNFVFSNNMNEVVQYTKENVQDENITGFMMAAWKCTIDEKKYSIYDGTYLLKKAKEKNYK